MSIYCKSVHYYGKRARDYARDTVQGYSPNHVVELVHERVIDVRDRIFLVWFAYIFPVFALARLGWDFGGAFKGVILSGIGAAALYIGLTRVKPWLSRNLAWYRQWYQMDKRLQVQSKQPYWWLQESQH